MEKVCLSCNNPVNGKFCSNCGEKVLTGHERSISHLLHEFFHILTHADSKFLKSLKLVLVKPGMLTANHIQGRRKQFSSPLSMFIIANVIYLLLSPVDALNSKYQSQHGQLYSKHIDGKINQKLAQRGWTEEQLAEEYNHESGKIAKLLLILLAVFFSIPLAIVFFKRSRYYYDHLVFSLEVMNYVIMVMLLLLPLLLVIVVRLLYLFDVHPVIDINSEAVVITLMLILLSYFTIATKRVYGERWIRSILKSSLLLIGFCYSVVLYRYILFNLTMALI